MDSLLDKKTFYLNDYVKIDFNAIPFAKNEKSQVPKFRRFVIDVGPHFGMIFGALSHKCPYFFGIDFWMPLWMPFI